MADSGTMGRIGLSFAPCDPPLYDDGCCALLDMDADGDVDVVDFGMFQVAFTDP